MSSKAEQCIAELTYVSKTDGGKRRQFKSRIGRVEEYYGGGDAVRRTQHSRVDRVGGERESWPPQISPFSSSIWCGINFKKISKPPIDNKHWTVTPHCLWRESYPSHPKSWYERMIKTWIALQRRTLCQIRMPESNIWSGRSSCDLRSGSIEADRELVISGDNLDNFVHVDASKSKNNVDNFSNIDASKSIKALGRPANRKTFDHLDFPREKEENGGKDNGNLHLVECK